MTSKPKLSQKAYEGFQNDIALALSGVEKWRIDSVEKAMRRFEKETGL